MHLPDYSTVFWITAVLAVTLLGIAKAGFGGGAAVIATPLLALTIPVADAAALLLPLLIIIDMISIVHYRGNFDRHSIRLMVPSAAVGILIGGLFFGTFSSNERVLKLGIGLLAVAFVLFQLFRTQIMGQLEGKRPSTTQGIFFSSLAGFTSTLAHAGGPPATIYLLPQKLPRQLFVGTTVVFFTAVNLIKLIPYSVLGLLKVGNVTTILILSPLCYLGVRLGIYLNGRFTDKWFNRLIYSLLFLTGIQLILGRSLLDFFVRF
ncbi:MAG: sulfite exporter TauE/SafE family protein [Ardenticatenaceae bacterium]|nr:sulfite exporter TauE/SafE family protein [Ardenticatenaceae bacterium]MCB9444917.1 sulfite exporter TauE/SafE family protein [Ardenticatenaceae bacterium]